MAFALIAEDPMVAFQTRLLRIASTLTPNAPPVTVTVVFVALRNQVRALVPLNAVP